MHILKTKLLPIINENLSKSYKLNEIEFEFVRKAPIGHPTNTVIEVRELKMDEGKYAHGFTMGYDRVDLKEHLFDLGPVRIPKQLRGAWLRDPEVFEVIQTHLKTKPMYTTDIVNAQLPMNDNESVYIQATEDSWIFLGIAALGVKYV